MNRSAIEPLPDELHPAIRKLHEVAQLLDVNEVRSRDLFNESSVLKLLPESAQGELSQVGDLLAINQNFRELVDPKNWLVHPTGMAINIGHLNVGAAILFLALGRFKWSEKEDLSPFVDEAVCTAFDMTREVPVRLTWSIGVQGISFVRPIDLGVARLRSPRPGREKDLFEGADIDTCAVLEGSFEARHSVSRDPTKARWNDKLWRRDFDQALLALLMHAEANVRIAETWESVESPLSNPSMRSAIEGRSQIRNVLDLTEDMASKVESNAARIAKILRDDRIREELIPGVHRFIWAQGRRLDPTDRFIDLSIALENLYGSKEGELSFRISRGAARVLKNDLDGRRELADRLKKTLYPKRSRIVHGDPPGDHGEIVGLGDELFVIVRDTYCSFLIDHPDLASGNVRSSEIFLSSRFDLNTASRTD